MNVLIVDDETDLREQIEDQIRDEFPRAKFWHARTVEDARAEVDELKRLREDLTLAVVDLRIPKEGVNNVDGGMSIIEELRGAFPCTAIVVNSVRTDAEVPRRAELVGAVVATKSGLAEDLLSAVRTSLLRHAP